MERITREITDAIKCLYDLTARTDERVKMLMENNRDIDESVETVKQAVNEIVSKVTIMERTFDHAHIMADLESLRDEMEATLKLSREIDARLREIESHQQKRVEYWKIVFDYVLRTIWNLWICWVLYKLHLQAPPVQ